MTRTHGGWSVACALFCVNLGFSFQSTVNIGFDQIFPTERQTDLGLTKLSEVEKDRLKAYVVQLMLDAYAEGKKSNDGSQHPGTTRTPAEPRRPSGSAYAGIGDGHWIDKNIDRGAMIQLEDGSIWKIDSYDKLETSLWLRISSITVLESLDCIGGYMLINTDDGEKACATLLSR